MATVVRLYRFRCSHNPRVSKAVLLHLPWEYFDAVNRVDPRSSRATTYNNLRDLVHAGLVREVAVEGRAARFDAKGMRHHHFICDRCGNVEDIEWYNVPRPAAGSLGKRVVRECELIFRGLCTQCSRGTLPVKFG